MFLSTKTLMENVELQIENADYRVILNGLQS